MIIIPNKNKDVFICYDSVDYENETYSTKVLNAKGEEILKDFNQVECIENYDGSGTWYETDLLKYNNQGKMGLINLEGKKVLDEEFENMYPIQGIQKSIIVEKQGKKGLVNSALNKIIIDAEYTNIEPLTDNYTDGYIVLNEDGKYGIIHPDGKVILECNYDKIQKVTGNQMYVISRENKNILINSKGEEILDLNLKEVIAINNNYLTYKQGEQYGVINTSNESIINPEYEYLKFIFDKFYIARKNNKYGIISIEGETKVDFNYEQMTYIENANIIEVEKENNKTDLLNNAFETKLSDVIVSEINIDKGFLRVRADNDYKYYNFKFEEKSNSDVLATNTLFLIKENGKYGYINKKGEKIVDAIYDDATEQNEYGYCSIKKDGKWGALKADGTVVVEPSVDLENNLYVYFVSSWHLYNDLSLNIYTK